MRIGRGGRGHQVLCFAHIEPQLGWPCAGAGLKGGPFVNRIGVNHPVVLAQSSLPLGILTERFCLVVWPVRLFHNAESQELIKPDDPRSEVEVTS